MCGSSSRPVLRAGAAIPDNWKRIRDRHEELGKRGWAHLRRHTLVAQRYEYLGAIEVAGGLKAYEKAHTKALAATLAKKFPAYIPEEIFPRVVAFWAHAGSYVSAAAVAALPRAAETSPNQDA